MILGTFTVHMGTQENHAMLIQEDSNLVKIIFDLPIIYKGESLKAILINANSPIENKIGYIISKVSFLKTLNESITAVNIDGERYQIDFPVRSDTITQMYLNGMPVNDDYNFSINISTPDGLNDVEPMVFNLKDIIDKKYGFTSRFLVEEASFINKLDSNGCPKSTKNELINKILFESGVSVGHQKKVTSILNKALPIINIIREEMVKVNKHRIDISLLHQISELKTKDENQLKQEIISILDRTPIRTPVKSSGIGFHIYNKLSNRSVVLSKL